MVKFAFLQLKNNELAEDVVQEAFVSAYKYADSFKGESALKTWIFAIFKKQDRRFSESQRQIGGSI